MNWANIYFFDLFPNGSILFLSPSMNSFS